MSRPSRPDCDRLASPPRGGAVSPGHASL